MVLSRIMVDKLQFIGEMRGETRVGNFSRKASPHPSKAFKKGINFTNLVLKNGETMPFSIVKWLLFLLSYVKLFAKLFLEKACRRRHASPPHPTDKSKIEAISE